MLDADRSPLRPLARSASATPARRRRRPSCSPRSRRRSPAPRPASTTARRRPARRHCSATPTWPASPGRSGSPRPGVDLRLGDDGEVCVRSEFLMDGYFEQPDATAEALQSTAGTTPATSARSTTRATSRSSVGPATCCAPAGRPSRPARSRRCLTAHPAVVEVAVVGLPDVQWGEVVCAVVVPADGPRRRPHASTRSVPTARDGSRRSSSLAASSSSRRSPARPRRDRFSAPCSSSG